MKIVVSCLLLLISMGTLQAQKTFEGTVTYAYEVKGENAEMMAAMIPQKMVIKYGKKGMITYMEGGMMAAMMGKIVLDGVNNETFVVKEAEKAVYLMKPEDMEEVEEPQVDQMIKQDEEAEILGYRCTKYQMVTAQEGMKTTQYIWVTDDLKTPDFKLPGMKNFGGGVLSGGKLPGFPMRVEVAITNMDATVVMTASELDPVKVDNKEFLRPKDYVVKDFSELLGSGNR